MPSSRFEHSATAAAPPSRVWTALQEAGTWAGIGPLERVWDATHRGGILAGYRWSTRAAGRRWEGTARTTEAIPGERITLELRSPEVNGSLTAALASDGAGATTVTVTLHVESVGILSGMFWDAVAGAIGGGFPGHVEEFAARFG